MPGFQYSPGEISGLTANNIPKALTPSSVGNSQITDNGTTITIPDLAGSPRFASATTPTTGFSLGPTNISFYRSGSTIFSLTSAGILMGSNLSVILGGSGSAASPLLQIGNGAGNHGFYSPAAQDMGMAANGTLIARLFGTANVEKFNFQKGVSHSPASVNNTYSLKESDNIVFADATTAAFTITLPAASANTIGQRWLIFKTDSGVNAITVSRAGANTINGVTSKNIAVQYMGLMIIGLTSSSFLALTLTAA